MIAKITMKLDETTETYLFGNSYKSWHLQFQEFVWEKRREKKDIQLLKVETCEQDWVGGGLKWCKISDFQEKLNEESRRKKWDVPRELSRFEFVENKKAYKKAVARLW